MVGILTREGHIILLYSAKPRASATTQSWLWSAPRSKLSLFLLKCQSEQIIAEDNGFVIVWLIVWLADSWAGEATSQIWAPCSEKQRSTIKIRPRGQYWSEKCQAWFLVLFNCQWTIYIVTWKNSFFTSSNFKSKDFTFSSWRQAHFLKLLNVFWKMNCLTINIFQNIYLLYDNLFFLL